MSTHKGNILLPLISAVAVLALLAAGYFFYQTQQNPGQALGPYTPSPVPTTQDETATWKTYNNNYFGYTIQYPAEFSLQYDCDDCNPPEVSVDLQNSNKTVTITISDQQGSLCANNTLSCDPVKQLNPKPNTQNYELEEFYSQDHKEYLFSLYLSNDRNGGIRIVGSYTSPGDAAKIDQILSTFKFTNNGN